MTTPERQRRILFLASLALLILPLAFAACAGDRRSLEPVPADAAAGLPSPSELGIADAARRSSYTEADLKHNGDAYSIGLPSRHVSDDGGTKGVFSPSYEQGDSIGDAAYCIHQFNLPDYDRNAQVRCQWSTPPAEGELWIGLADWDRDAWTWRAANPVQPLDLLSLDPFIRHDDQLLVVLLCLGTDQALLDWVRIGSQAPEISLVAEGVSGFVPLSGSIDASASSDPDGSIVESAWDLDGDGSFETVSELTDIQPVELEEARGYQVGLRLTDNDGVSSTAKVSVRGFEEWQHSWGSSGYEDSAGTAYDGVGAIYLAGNSDFFGAGGDDVVLLKYSLAGELVWQRVWGTGVDNLAEGIEVDSEGNVLVLTQSDPLGAGLLKLSPDGELIWSRQYAPLSTIFVPSGLDTSGTDIYFCGFQFGGADVDSGVIARIDGDGEPIWLRRWSGGDLRLESLQVQRTSVFEDTVTAVGEQDEDVFALRLDAEGELVFAETWGGPEQERGNDLVITGPFNPEFWICGSDSSGDTIKPLLLQRGGSAIAKVWDAGSTNADQENASGIVRTSDGRVLLGGWTSSFTVIDALLLGYSTTGTLQFGSRIDLSAGDVNFNAGIELYAGTALVGCGWADAANGTSWAPAGGTVSDRSFSWVDAPGTLSPVNVSASDILGIMGEPSGAVLDSGAGDGDMFIAVRALP